MHILGTPTWGHLAAATLIAFVIGYLVSIGLDRLFLKRGNDDRVTGIALSCALTFALLMGMATFILTAASPIEGPIIVPPFGYAVSFLLALAAVGVLRMRAYTAEYVASDDQAIFDSDGDHSLYDEEVVAWDEEHGGKNYLIRHWLGQLPLPVSYWVNGALLSIVIALVAEFLASRIRSGGASLGSLAVVALAFLAFSLLVWIWSSVGIWRSAYWHRRRGGTPGWGVAARVLVVLTAFATVLRSGDLALQAGELGNLALGTDPIGKVAEMNVSADGRELFVRGNLSQGAARRFGALLEDSPRVRSVVLTSPGGRMLEAERMAAAVRERRLDTRVDDFCMSACISVLLAGRDRSAPNLARIGFHQPSFPGLTPAEMRGAIEETRTEYIAAGVEPGFVWRALGTPARDMWFPTAEELVAANVLTGSDIVVVASGTPRRAGSAGRSSESLSEKRLRSELQALAAHINRSAPIKLDGITTLHRASASGLTVTNHYEVKIGKREAAAAKAELARLIRGQVCGDRFMAAAVRDGGRFAYSYDSVAGQHLFDFTIDECPSPRAR